MRSNSKTTLNNYTAYIYKKPPKSNSLQPYDLSTFHDDLFSQSRIKPSTDKTLSS